MRVSRFPFAAIILIALFPFPAAFAASPQTTTSAAHAASSNLIDNSGFEQGDTGWTWMTANGARASGALDTREKHSGAQSYRITSDSDQAPNVFGRLYRTVYGLRPFTTYHISAWVKGSNVGIAWIGGGPGWTLRFPFPKGSYGWQPLAGDYTTGADAGAFEFMVLVESRTTAVWVDDIEMTEVRADIPRRTLAEHAARTSLDAVRAHLERVRRIAASHPQLRDDRYVALGLSVAARFLARLDLPPGKLQQGGDWSALQIEEVQQVLDATEQQIVAHLKAPQPVFDTDPKFARGKVAIRDGVFATSAPATKEKGGKRGSTGTPSYRPGARSVPIFFDGYGHFGSVASDLPNFPALGASLIQQERGPSMTIGPDSDKLLDTGRSIVDTLDAARRSGVKIDLLLSPHYLPDWAVAKAPEIRNGNIGFITYNIDHPVARTVMERHLHTLLPAVRDSPGLLSLCLSNEPVYDSSGRDPYSRPLWTAYLRRKHGDVATLNALYGTRYARLDDVPVPAIGMPDATKARRAYYDWVRFNQEHFADWHKWMSDLAHREAPGTPTHAKIMVFNTFDRNLLHFGVDPELFCAATDIAGCDAYAFFRNEWIGHFPSKDSLTPEAAALLPEDYAYSWQGQEMFYDLLHAFNRQPVFNSENHIIPDGSPAFHIPAEHTRAALWQGGLHHQAATTIWVWEDSFASGLGGSIYFRPANIYAAGRAFLDLNRLSREVVAINQQPPRVALLYSQPSIFWEGDYGAQVSRLYTTLRFMGEACTFVSERQLQSGKFPPVDWIIAPHATHVEDGTVSALHRFVAQQGGKLLLIGADNLMRDEYDQPRTLPSGLTIAAVTIGDKTVGSATDNRVAFVGALRSALGDAQAALPRLYIGTGTQPTWGVEYNAVPEGKRLLVPMIDFLPEAQTVRLELPAGSGAKGATTVRDLLSGETIDLKQIRLSPLEPRLLEVQ